MRFIYDEEADILYAFYGRPTSSIYESAGSGIYIRKDEKTDNIVGFMILNYASRLNQGKLPPIPHFENTEVPSLEQLSEA